MLYLEKIKRKVNKEFQGNIFDIHLTLAGPYLSLKEKYLHVVGRVAKPENGQKRNQRI